MVYKLLKVLYGLKQLSRLWYKILSDFLLQKLGISCINTDYNIFMTLIGLDSSIISTFIDDIKIIGIKSSGIIQRVKSVLATTFLMVYIGLKCFYLGLKVRCNRKKKMLKLSQSVYIDKILEKFQLDKTNVVQTPRKKEVLFTLRIESETLASKQKQYHSITRSLMFSIMKTRLNIFFSSSVTSCFSKILLYQHIEDVKTIQHYLKGSGERSITYEGKKNLMIEEYSNSD